MNHIKYTLGVSIIATVFTLHSQETKIFNDSFQEGRANYEYYTDANYNIIYNGFFNYYGEKYTVNGAYSVDTPKIKTVSLDN